MPLRNASRGFRALLVMWLALVCVPVTRAQRAVPAAHPAESSASTPVRTPEPVRVYITNEDFAQSAEQQGRADAMVLNWVLANSGPIKGDMRAGELRIAFTITPAEGWWDKAGGGTLAWHEAPANAMHLRIFLIDAADGRLMPGLTLRAMLVDANSNEQSAPTDFGWYPLINAYGGNVPLDADSSYTLRVTVEPLDSQHIFSQGERFVHPTVAEFPAVQITRAALAQLPLATATAFNQEVELLKPASAALSTAITALWQHSASGSEKASADYFVGYALDYGTMFSGLPSAKLRLRNMIHLAGSTELRLVLFPRDSRTGRFIPGLKPHSQIEAANGEEFGPGELPLNWHPWFNHYGHSVLLPRKGPLKMHVHFDAPSFRRWGRQSERFAEPVDVDFDNVSLKEEAKK